MSCTRTTAGRGERLGDIQAQDVLYIDPYGGGGISDSHIDQREQLRAGAQTRAPARDPAEGIQRFTGSSRRHLRLGPSATTSCWGPAATSGCEVDEFDQVIWDDRLPNTTGNNNIDGGPGDDRIWGDPGNNPIPSR